MAGQRIVYWDWILQLADAPPSDRTGSRKLPPSEPLTSEQIAREQQRRELIEREVARAMDNLAGEEQGFIRRFYFEGKRNQTMAEQSGRAVHKLEALHKRAFRKLRRDLTPLVKKLYALETTQDSLKSCVICNSPYRPQIDLLIRYREKSETWRNIIRTIRREYGIRISTPQILIGHEKYH